MYASSSKLAVHIDTHCAARVTSQAKADSDLDLVCLWGEHTYVLVHTRGLSGTEDLTVGLQDQLILQIYPQNTAVLPLLVRQIRQNGSRGLKHVHVTGEH